MRRRTTWVAGALICLVSAGCTGDDGGSDDKESPGGGEQVRKVSVNAKVAVTRGRLPQRGRKALAKDVASVVDRWFEAAYLGGDYPRSNFADAYPGFTQGAAQRAKADRALMSNADIGSRVDAVAAKAKVVRVDVVAARGKAAGVTSRFRLVFDTTGRMERRVTVDGRLFLTRGAEGKWRIFGYDVTKGAA